MIITTIVLALARSLGLTPDREAEDRVCLAVSGLLGLSVLAVSAWAVWSRAV